MFPLEILHQDISLLGMHSQSLAPVQSLRWLVHLLHDSSPHVTVSVLQFLSCISSQYHSSFIPPPCSSFIVFLFCQFLGWHHKIHRIKQTPEEIQPRFVIPLQVSLDSLFTPKTYVFHTLGVLPFLIFSGCNLSLFQSFMVLSLLSCL